MANEENRQFTPEQEKDMELKAVWAELIRLRAEVEEYKKIFNNETDTSRVIRQTASNFLSLLDKAKEQGVREGATLLFELERHQYADLNKDSFVNIIVSQWKRKTKRPDF